MKKYKYLLLLSLISYLSHSLDINTEINVGGSAAWGGDGISYGFNHLPNVLNVALPRENTFDESDPQIPSFTVESRTPSPKSTITWDFNSNSPNKKKPIYVPSGTDQDIELSKRYVSRGVTIDKTLLDAKIKLKENDNNAEFGLMIKGRPHRIDQNFSLFDINRSYMYAKVNTKPIKLDSTMYFIGYENGTPGMNRFSENGYRDPKKNGQLDLSSSITPLNTIISPIVDLEYQGTILNHDKYAFKPGVSLNFNINDNINLTVSAKYLIGDNNQNRVFNDFKKDIRAMAPGNYKIEYFKKWEIGELELDKEYNKDKTILGKDGYAAYRYIGKRDIKKGTLTGLNGSIRAVGEYTGALYGQTFLDKAINIGIEKVTSTFDKDSALSRISDEFKNLVYKKHKNNGWEVFKAGVRELFKGDFSKLDKEINDLMSNKNGGWDKLVNSLGYEFLSNLDEDDEWKNPVSDFYATHYIPREFRKYMGDFLPKIPYEDSEANINFRKGQLEEGDVIVGEDPNAPKKDKPNTTPSKPIIPKIYEDDPNKVKLLGSSKLDKNQITVWHDSRRAAVHAEFNPLFNDLSSLIQKIGRKEGFISLAKGAMSIFRDLLSSNNPNPLLLKLINESETLSAFDMYAGLQINQSESRFRDKDFSKLLLNTYLKDLNEALNGNDKYTISNEKPKISKGFEINSELKTKNINLKIDFKNRKYIDKENIEGKYIINREKWTSPLTDLYKPHFLNYIVNTIGDREFLHKRYRFDTKINTNSILNQNIINTQFNYINNNIDMGISLGYIQDNIHFDSIETDYLKYFYHNAGTIDGKTWIHPHTRPSQSKEFPGTMENSVEYITKTNIDYTRHILTPKFDINIKNNLTSWLESNVFLGWEGLYRYIDYKDVSATRYVNKNGINKEPEPIKLMVFKRDKNGLLIKSKNAPKTGNEEFDNIPAGSSIDISKYSKYLIDDIENTFEKEEKTGVSRWDISKNYFKFGTNMYIYPTNNIKIGYHLLIPISFKGVDIDGFFIRNGLSLGFVF